MPAIITPRLVCTPVYRFHPDTRRELALLEQLQVKGELTPAELRELDEITDRQLARAYAADLAHDQATEAHAYPTRPNPHCD